MNILIFLSINGKRTFQQTFLRQPFGDNWETYTWSEAGMMARKLATGLKSLGLKEKKPYWSCF